MSIWNLKITQPSPSMNQEKEVIQADTYEQAVEQAQRRWKETGRTVGLYDGEWGMYCWYYIGQNGKGYDRNTTGGSGAKTITLTR